jgi:hypothetical protein
VPSMTEWWVPNRDCMSSSLEHLPLRDSLPPLYVVTAPGSVLQM